MTENSQTKNSNPEPKALQGVRVLLVEDVLDNQKLISRFLSRQGAEVEFAGNGQEGIEKALKDRFDVVLMDIKMPLMDGYKATEELRHRGYLRPIIALTAHAMEDVKKKCLAVGYTDYLAKPITSKDLIQTVSRYTVQSASLH